MVAASDTTATLLCGFIRSVLQTPAVYERLVSKRKNADLFWGLRGAGGGFGIVTSTT
ncbi:hypothetical protein GGS24DRAFT_478889 [Hypoxylon argillaceum]|nr:hypothetical protein GGS24DRAFT_478889 [Hypoxylon argillaceum]